MIRYIQEVGAVRVIIEADTAEEIVALRDALEGDDGGWVEWGGGECPVSGDTLVEVKFRFDEKSEFVLPASEWEWEHNDDDYDIVKYRVVKNV